ncbi:DJ-1/PfpI family protein [Apibacter adventoris]|uniref:DJ-1/PfpI family protein n=1 Tax=Apibacter adventoris TaxID=1679466 RepID=UPI000CF6CBAD|nr:DJ-1/PfpI family protein [Apibacter adventoris]PQL94711.1 dimethyladenosine transferase [Apibacter adventoris]
MKEVSILLFKDFETLDVFGPVEIFGRLKDVYSVTFYSLNGGIIQNSHGVSLETVSLEKILQGTDIFLIPGGRGTRKEINNIPLLDIILQISQKSQFILTVCTGSALLAKTGLLNGRIATSNKKAFQWVISNNLNVKWLKKARWTKDGKFYTSSGISSGMDMVLGFISDLHGEKIADTIASEIEYNWQKDKTIDNFSI